MGLRERRLQRPLKRPRRRILTLQLRRTRQALQLPRPRLREEGPGRHHALPVEDPDLVDRDRALGGTDLACEVRLAGCKLALPIQDQSCAPILPSLPLHITPTPLTVVQAT